MMKKMMGFTLAEVLTTLMVIGVVAAMTIPTLMNSTNDQQLKVAYKKAMSVLSQGTQLMVAKEVECPVKDDASLAECFQKNVLSGSLVGYKNSGTDNGQAKNNVVTTSDGMAFAFYYYGAANDDNPRSLEDICGTTATLGTDRDAYAGKGAKCLVVVDVNGFSKGSKQFRDVKGAPGNSGKSAAVDTNLVYGTEQMPIILTGTGVRAIYSEGNAFGKGYEWMYGTTVAPYTGN